MDPIQQKVTRQSGEMPRPVVTDNNEPRSRGRPTVDKVQLRQEGMQIRHNLLTIRLAVNNLRRPLLHDMKVNSYGHIYMTN
jgi:hypothetical protein